MTLRERLIQEALTWEDTPYHHHAALKGVGCDCVGLIRGVAKAVGLVAYEPQYYSPQWGQHNDDERLLGALEELGCLRRDPELALPGDCLLFQFGKTCSHAALLVSSAPLRIIHASLKDGRVVHQTITRTLQLRWRHAYVLPGVPL